MTIDCFSSVVHYTPIFAGRTWARPGYGTLRIIAPEPMVTLLVQNYRVTAPSEAEDTDRAYLASTPVVYMGGNGCQAARRESSSS